MRFIIEFKDFRSKKEQNHSLSLLETFLNEHLISEFHGKTFECILIRYINHAPQKKKFKLRPLYKIIAEVEIEGEFSDKTKLNIEDFQQGLEKVKQAIHLVSAIEVKEELDFNHAKILASLKRVKNSSPKTNQELKEYANREDNIKFLNTVKRVDTLLAFYKANPQPLVKRIKGVRLYHSFSQNALAPYDSIYTELFSNLLRCAEVKLPDYEEIYVSIGGNMEQAKQEIALEEFFKYTYSTINLSDYNQEDAKGKAGMVLKAISQGLRFIADFDHLEKEKIEAVIETIAQNGMDMELNYATAKNRDYIAEIFYHVPQSPLTKTEFKLKITETKTMRTGTTLIDKFSTYYAPYSLGNIQIKKNEIIIKGRNSLRAEISREIDKLPSEYRFRMDEVLD